MFYDDPALTLDRVLTTMAVEGTDDERFREVMRSQLGPKQRAREFVAAELGPGIPVRFTRHHVAHAASAFFPSPFDEAAILTMDGVGEWETTSLAVGEGASLTPVQSIEFPHSLGLLYSSVTRYCGFKVNSGEYKLMGLAPYGTPIYQDLIRENLIALHEDGSFALNLDYFAFGRGDGMTTARFDELFGGPPREQESAISRREMDIAASIQAVTEDAVLGLARNARERTGKRHLCLAGGVALNCVANGRLLREGIFDDIWIQPAAGDAGGALGAAYIGYHALADAEPRKAGARDAQKGSYLGSLYSMPEVRAELGMDNAVFTEIEDDIERAETVASLLADGNVVGFFAGRMEFGPRSLGGRSIIGDPRNPAMQVQLNLKIKYRESFRPFAPAVLEDRVSEYFELDRPSPYMLLVAPVAEERCIEYDRSAFDEGDDDMLSVVRVERSDLPSITHVDYSARVQTVQSETNPRFHELLSAFERQTGCGVLVNTSFNVRGEPIVASPRDAYRCFMRTEMDVLVVEDAILYKQDQPSWKEDDDWRARYDD